MRKTTSAGHRTRTPAVLVTTAALTFGLTGFHGPRAAADPSVAAPGAPVDCRRATCVALTFDDSPSVRTPRILDILRRHHAHATFFTLGKSHVLTYPGTVRRMVAEGHEVETLTWSHRILTRITPAEAREEIVRGRDAVERVTGRRPVLLRPPQGRTNGTVTAICRELGMAEVEWTVSASDYETTDPGLIADRVLSRTGPDGIVLLHDLVDPSNRGYNGTVAALPRILGALRSRGYTFVTVSQLLAPARPEPGAIYW